jgi:DNA-directed RNA polymerase specialized sigma24 family protein
MRMNESDFNKILFSVLFLNAKNFIRIMYTNKEKFLTSAIAEDKINYEKDFNIEYEITDMLMEKERDDQIRGIIEHMPDSIRTIVILKYQGFSNQYISDTLNVNIKDIKNKMSIFKKIVVQRKISVK